MLYLQDFKFVYPSPRNYLRSVLAPVLAAQISSALSENFVIIPEEMESSLIDDANILLKIRPILYSLTNDMLL